MRLGKLSAALFVLAAACGGSSALDPALNGTWTGPTTFTVTGNAPQTGTGSLKVAVSGQNAVLSEICLDGTGSVTMPGSGNSASWTGSFDCPPVQFTNCAAVILTFKSATISLNNATLTAQGSGTGAGCGATISFSLALTGTKS